MISTEPTLIDLLPAQLECVAGSGGGGGVSDA